MENPTLHTIVKMFHQEAIEHIVHKTVVDFLATVGLDIFMIDIVESLRKLMFQAILNSVTQYSFDVCV